MEISSLSDSSKLDKLSFFFTKNMEISSLSDSSKLDKLSSFSQKVWR